MGVFQVLLGIANIRTNLIYTNTTSGEGYKKKGYKIIFDCSQIFYTHRLYLKPNFKKMKFINSIIHGEQAGVKDFFHFYTDAGGSASLYLLWR